MLMVKNTTANTLHLLTCRSFNKSLEKCEVGIFRLFRSTVNIATTLINSIPFGNNDAVVSSDIRQQHSVHDLRQNVSRLRFVFKEARKISVSHRPEDLKI